HARATADLDIAEDLGAGADEDAAADLRMAVAALLAGAAERHPVQDRDIVLDHRGLADDEAGGMIKQDAAADGGVRMDVHLEHLRGAALQPICEVASPMMVEHMGEAVRLDRLESLEEQHRLDIAVAGRIAVLHRD